MKTLKQILLEVPARVSPSSSNMSRQPTVPYNQKATVVNPAVRPTDPTTPQTPATPNAARGQRVRALNPAITGDPTAGTRNVGIGNKAAGDPFQASQIVSQDPEFADPLGMQNIDPGAEGPVQPVAGATTATQSRTPAQRPRGLSRSRSGRQAMPQLSPAELQQAKQQLGIESSLPQLKDVAKKKTINMTDRVARQRQFKQEKFVSKILQAIPELEQVFGEHSPEEWERAFELAFQELEK